MIEEIAGQIIQLIQLNNILLFVVLFVFLIIAYKVFQCAVKALIFGAIAASFPVIAYFAGIQLPAIFVEMSFLSRILWFGFFGIMAYIFYFLATHSLRTMRFVLSPFKRMFKEKPKVVEKNKTIYVKEEDD